MRSQLPARRHFRALIRLPEEQLNLGEAAACIAWEDQELEALPPVLEQLDALAADVRLRLRGLDTPGEQVGALNGYLFDELEFTGNTSEYNDPANSYLDRVLARRTGLPITLALVYLEVGWRLELPLVGFAMPGHFLVRYPSPSGDLVIDPFHRGRMWSASECADHLAAYFGGAPSTLMARVMQPPTKREILVRMLRNLKVAYVERAAFAKALAAVERLFLVERNDPSEVRDRGLLRIRVGQLHSGLEDLDRYARLRPDASDIATLQKQARAVAAELIAGN